MTSGRAAVFLDRDGVINAVVMRDGKVASPRLLSEFMLEPGVEEALAELRQAGFLLFVVTNQPDIRRGLMSPQVLDAIHARLRDLLPVDDIAFCPHDNADECECRKPKPGMLLDLAKRWNVDLARSFMIGDQDRDIECGRRAGCITILLGKSYNSGSEAKADYLVSGITAAAGVILAAQP
ncbi:MAG: HAD family hydrolase [Parvibaculaceae bacterium]|nr:HAD family hydrolase [Parvibaculaceae bacterium]